MSFKDTANLGVWYTKNMLFASVQFYDFYEKPFKKKFRYLIHPHIAGEWHEFGLIRGNL